MAVLDKLAELKARYQELQGLLSDPAIYVESERDRFRRFSKEAKQLEPIARAYDQYKTLSGNIETAREMLEITQGAERDASQKELEGYLAELDALEALAKVMLMPRDPRDDKPVILEVRAGTGGDEAALFAGELLDMYRRYSEGKGWTFSIVDASDADQGGVKEAIVEVEGDRAFSHLRWESGTHRVQRVPVTESQGRIHTSAATVAVLSLPDPQEITIDMKDIEMDFFRSSGAGGQHVNKTSSAVRLTHVPSGIIVASQDQRSQHQNRDKCLQVLMAKLQERDEQQRTSAAATERKLQVGSGDRSEKIRTYNF
ncbi:MAG: peptide chain release factor 1, partial [bacterium]